MHFTVCRTRSPQLLRPVCPQPCEVTAAGLSPHHGFADEETNTTESPNSQILEANLPPRPLTTNLTPPPTGHTTTFSQRLRQGTGPQPLQWIPCTTLSHACRFRAAVQVPGAARADGSVTAEGPDLRISAPVISYYTRISAGLEGAQAGGVLGYGSLSLPLDALQTGICANSIHMDSWSRGLVFHSVSWKRTPRRRETRVASA